jgi:hypothetical protein
MISQSVNLVKNEGMKEEREKEKCRGVLNVDPSELFLFQTPMIFFA